MLRVGLTGGYASGKSLVAKHLESLGCHVIYADALGHQVMRPGGEAYQPVVALFGREIVNADETINRKKLAGLVFSDPEQLQRLNAIVHPAVFQLEEELLLRFEQQAPRGIGVLEAAVLIEAGAYRRFDKLIVTSCSQETQIARAMKRDHVTREEAMLRIERQLSDAERLQHASYVIQTDGSIAETIEQTGKIHAELRQLAEAFLR